MSADTELKQKKLNRLMNIGLAVLGIVLLFSIGYLALNIYGNSVDPGVMMRMRYIFESDRPIDDVIAEQGWEDIDDEITLLCKVSGWTYNNIRYPRSILDMDNDNAYVTLDKKVGNCLGQAHLVYLFCRKLGVKSYLLEFINGNIGHAVNIISIEGKNGHYIMDTTINFFGPARDYFRAYEVKGIDYSLPEHWAEELEGEW